MPILHEHIEGKYEILGKLREGGMGAVYKVRHRLLDEVLVVKVLNPRLDVTPELNDRFLREARFAIQLRHPNIAQLHDFSMAEDGRAFIVMEFIDGSTLEEIVTRTGPPPLGLGLEMARQSLKALGFLHRRGLIHRDISPDNLMLTRDAEGEPLVKLIDLGIAKVLKGGAGGLTSTGMFLGKPRYASPEQFSATGLSGVDARADLYSFGVVLYELLTGVCPIQGRDPGSLMAGHLFRPPLDFAESDRQGRLPADLRAILLRALAKVPDERFASAEELSRALAGVQDRHPVEPGDLEAVLEGAAVPAPPKAQPGTTQGKLDQQFVQTPSPARTEPPRKNPDTTLVLSPHERPVVLPETFAIPREATPVATPPPVVPPPGVPPPAAPAKVAAPPPVAAPMAPRVEAPRPIRQPARLPQKRRSLLSLGVMLALLLLVGVGVGLWLWARRSEPAPAAAVAQTSAPATLEATIAPAPSQPAPVASAPPLTTEVSIAAEPVPPLATLAPARPKPEPAPVREPSVEKAARQPDISETGRPAAPLMAVETATSTEKPSESDTVLVAPTQPNTERQVAKDKPIHESTEEDRIVGLWYNSSIKGGLHEIRKNPGAPGYITIQASDDSTTALRGEVVELFTFDPSRKKFIGRHLWGGGKSTTKYWGQEGALELSLNNPDSFDVIYSDSRNKGGWTFHRVTENRATSTAVGPQTGDVRPQLRSVPTPGFPLDSKGKVTYARIIVAVRLDASGDVIDARVTKVSFKGPASQSFLDAAQAAAKKAHYDPALRLGKPVEAWGELMFEFGKKPEQ